ncbi:MAG: hypothetical protein ABIZ72_02300 [Candidatus Limnocylindrales bacterium]
MTRTRSIHGASFRKAGWLAAGAMLAVAALAPASVGAATTWATVTGHQAFSNDANNPDYWGTDCTKIDSVDGSLGDSYVLLADYGLVVVKAGSGEFANTLFADASAGESVWADTNGDGIFNPGGGDGDKGISHIIFCDLTETTSTTTESTGSESSTSTTSTTTESTGTESSTTGSTTTNSSTGDELGITGTPGVTPPPTDTIAAPTVPAGQDGYRVVLLGLAVLLALVLLVQPKGATSRR